MFPLIYYLQRDLQTYNAQSLKLLSRHVVPPSMLRHAKQCDLTWLIAIHLFHSVADAAHTTLANMKRGIDIPPLACLEDDCGGDDDSDDAEPPLKEQRYSDGGNDNTEAPLKKQQRYGDGNDKIVYKQRRHQQQQQQYDPTNVIMNHDTFFASRILTYKILDNKTSSDSVQVAMNMQNTHLFAKIHLVIPENINLLYEWLVYKVFKYIYDHKWTPHVVLYKGLIESTIPELLSMHKSIWYNIAFMLTDGFEDDTTSGVNILLTEQIFTKTLHKWLWTKTAKEWMSSASPSSQQSLTTKIRQILWQLFWTLAVMQRLRIMHNDLHLNNIFVGELPRGVQSIHYKHNNNVYRINSHFVRIYDFDRSVIDCAHPNVNYPDLYKNFEDELCSLTNCNPANKCSNRYLDAEFCAKFKQCDIYNVQVDTFKVLAMLHFNYPTFHNIIGEFIERQVDSASFANWRRVYPEDKFYGIGWDQMVDNKLVKILHGPVEILNDPFFDELKVVGAGDGDDTMYELPAE